MHRRLREYHLLFVMTALVGAGVCYAVGFGLGIICLLMAGAVFELAFWILALTSTAE